MQRPDLRTLADERVVVLDGATGTGLQLLDLSLSDFDGLEGCNEVLNVSRPDAVAALHESYLEAGADAVLTNTFGGSSITLGEYELSERTREINRESARIARSVVDRFSTAERPRYVLGSLGPGTKLPSLGHVGFDELHAAYLEQARGLLEGEVDALLVETVYDLLQGKAAILACKDALAEIKSDTLLFATVTIETTGQMLVGSEIGAAFTALAPLGLDGIGLNCATGPDLMHEPLRYLSANAETTLLCSPNAGLPRTENGQMIYDLTPSELADAHRTFVSEYGVGIVGGCCGTTPEHVRAMREAMNGMQAVSRSPEPEPSAASLFVSTPYRQDASFLIVGERANANGSRRFKRLLQNEEWEQMANVIRDQSAEGAHVADVCVDFVGRDGTPDMAELVSRARGLSTLPLMLDSTEPGVLEAGLKQLGGKAIVNSINLEDGGKRLDQTLSAAVRFGAGVVALVIDEEGQARTCDRKLEIARRLYRIATEDYDLSPEDLFFDALTLPVSTGQEDLRRDGLETLDAVEAISREFPRAQTILGVSNISFGLNPAARQVLNSVFLHDAVGRGLKAAIVHAAQILPINRIPKEQLDAARRLILDEWLDGPEGPVDPLPAFMALFEDAQAATQERERLDDLPLEERLHRRIVDGQREGLESDLDEALVRREAIPIINELLLPAMQEVGDLFGAGDMQLPFVLQSAETMKRAVAHLEPHMDRLESTSKGSIVLATVRGDVHDIGKNLVEIILSNNGFTTVNLGIKQPISNVIEAALEHNADAIGLSGLLVKSTLVMKEDLEELNRRELADRWPVLLGGAALTRKYVEWDLRNTFHGDVFYGQDAFEGLRIMNALSDGVTLEREPVEPMPGPTASSGALAKATATAVRSTLAPAATIPSAPFLGTRVIRGLPLTDVFPYINRTALLRGQWGFKGRDAATSASAEQALSDIQQQALREGVLEPAVVYGYFPAQSDGDDLIVFDAEGRGTEAVRFSFPRQQGKQSRCLSDYFRSVDSGEMDLVGFHVVTMGSRVGEYAQELYAADRYQEYLYWHGFGVEIAEALAEYWHRRIRQELGIDGSDGATPEELIKTNYQGARYSFGYPACPNLEDQALLWTLLEPERISVTLSEEFQMHPEQSTSALIVHHPEARYFNI
ncbi:MAG: methionine synthase [Chloroflexi bacterium]|nr:methionine synthase [Chloroflexota bacterium]MCY3696785.1 methionine synthase [Chloroflexota bacterium]